MMIAQDHFYVYLHLRESDGKPFYVGKGCGKRAYHFSGRSQYWNRVKNKHGVEVKILFNNIEESLAFELEKEIITTLRNDGYELCNLTDGGEGTKGIVVSEETRKKLSDVHKGRNFSPESIEKMRQSHLGMIASEEARKNMSLVQIGKTHTDEAKKKMSETHYNKPDHYDKTVYTFNHKNGDYFVGTRIELSRKYGFNPQRLNILFTKNPTSTALGWSVNKISVEE